MSIKPASLMSGNFAAWSFKSPGNTPRKGQLPDLVPKNDLVTASNPELMKTINKHQMYQGSMLDSQLLVGSMKNMAEIKANINMQAAKATIPSTPYKNNLKNEIIKQAERQLDAAVKYAQNAEKRNEDVAETLMNAESSLSVEV